MVSRRHALTLLGSTATVGLSGCLFGGIGGGDAGPPPTVSNRRVEATGSVPQYQVDAANTGRLPETLPVEPSVAWRRTPNRYDAAQPVVGGDAVYVAFDGNLVKLTLDDGDEAWTVDAGHDSVSAPAVHDGVVYLTVWNGGASVPRGLVAVDAAEGTERWRALTDNDLNASPTPTDDAVFVGGGHENSEVAAVEHDGTVRWRRDLGVYAAAPAVVDGRAIYATGESGSVVALDAETGETVWEQSVDGRTTAAPAVVGESVVVADETGTVRRLDITTGEERWHATVDGRIDHSVAVDSAESRSAGSEASGTPRAAGEAGDSEGHGPSGSRPKTDDNRTQSDDDDHLVVAHEDGVVSLALEDGENGGSADSAAIRPHRF